MWFTRLIVATAFVVAATSSAVASPTMIRLGYTSCAACHISPRGGGLLTLYGHGVDAAQSFRSREYQPSDVKPARFLYDVRFVAVGLKTDDLSGQTHPGTATTYELMFR